MTNILYAILISIDLGMYYDYQTSIQGKAEDNSVDQFTTSAQIGIYILKGFMCIIYIS